MTDAEVVLAAEYVLGTLSDAEAQSVARQLETDQDLRALVTWWEQRLAPMAALNDRVPAPDALWSRIEAHLPAARDLAASAESAAVVELRGALRRWRTAAAGFALLAASLAFVGIAIDRHYRRDLGASYIAVVNRGGDQPALIVRVDVPARKISVRPLAAEAPSGRSLELWYIGKDHAPLSMGVVEKAEQMPLPAAFAAENASFAVTLEPPGGSPNGNPTGPIVYSGQLLKE